MKSNTALHVKMPFVVTKYVPDPESIPDGKKGKPMGLACSRNSLKMVSKQPMRVVDDQAFLKYLDLNDSESENEDCRKRNEIGSVSRKFNKKTSARQTRAATKHSLGPVDQRLLELLECLPKDTRISMR